MNQTHPQAGLPQRLGAIRAAHEDDTADELTLCEAIAARRRLTERIEADRRISWSEWTELKTYHRTIEHYALKSLNNNRQINTLYGALYRGAAFDADARSLCPELGEITIGELLAGTEWPEAA